MGASNHLIILQASSSLLGSSNSFAPGKSFEVVQCNIPWQAFNLCHQSHEFKYDLGNNTGEACMWAHT